MKRILLIEDDPEIAHLLQLELGDAGFEVDWAPGGMSGLVRLREAPPIWSSWIWGCPIWMGAR